MSDEERLCRWCGKPLSFEDAMGNSKYHKDCRYEKEKERNRLNQKRSYAKMKAAKEAARANT